MAEEEQALTPRWFSFLQVCSVKGSDVATPDTSQPAGRGFIQDYARARSALPMHLRQRILTQSQIYLSLIYFSTVIVLN